ncbi:MAG: hypothetical protein ACLQU3_23155 [Limisphaerales bacterium]
MKVLRVLVSGAALCSLFNAANFTFAQGTAFTYSGQLQNNGSPANGLYDFQFSLSNAPSGGSQVGGTVAHNAGSSATAWEGARTKGRQERGNNCEHGSLAWGQIQQNQRLRSTTEFLPPTASEKEVPLSGIGVVHSDLAPGWGIQFEEGTK